MLDFGSALYLGMRHPGAALARWEALTLGKPAAAGEPPGAAALAAALARLAGTEAATLLPSTLHLFWDLMKMLALEPIALLVDAGSYPIARWCAQCAAASGTPLRLFKRGSAGMALRLASAAASAGRRPVIVSDGYFPGDGGTPPLRAYAAIARQLDGYLVLDDTQALGLFGQRPGPRAPYGSGGGGSARMHGLEGRHVLVGASLAKGFGAPLAVLCACGAMVRRFEQHSDTRVHSSPPSVAAILAGQRALELNREQGDALRLRLWQLVARFRAAVARHGLALRGGQFPVQTLEPGPGIDGARLHDCLRAAGVGTVPRRLDQGVTVSFLITAAHAVADIERAVALLAACVRRQGSTNTACLEAT
jgi:8-amino-7-oxononanoate synthase